MATARERLEIKLGLLGIPNAWNARRRMAEGLIQEYRSQGEDMFCRTVDEVVSLVMQAAEEV